MNILGLCCHTFFNEKKKERKRSCPNVAIDQHAFGVSYSRWRQQRLSGRRRGWGRSVEIAVYGCIDTCSRKMLWAKVWVYLYKATTIVSKLRLDKGSETGVMALVHSFNFSDSIMGTWIQWRQSCMGHQLPIKYVYFFMWCSVLLVPKYFNILTLNVCINVLPFFLVI